MHAAADVPVEGQIDHAADLIVRDNAGMRTISAAEASRRFSELLDAIEDGETVIVTRGNRRIAEVRPVRRRTGRDLRASLPHIPPPDDRFVADIAEAIGSLADERTHPRIGD